MRAMISEKFMFSVIAVKLGRREFLTNVLER